MHFYGFNIARYQKKAGHLSPLEDAAYRRMLDVYYDTERPLQGDVAAIARRIRMRDHVGDVEAVLREFFDETAKGWRNQTCEEELAAYRRACRRNRENGKLGGRPKGSRSHPNGNPLGSDPDAGRSLRHSHPQPVCEGGSEGAAPKPEPEQRTGLVSTAAIRECLLELGVLRLSAKKREALAGKIAAAGWRPGDLRRLAEQVKGKTEGQRAARLAGLLQDDENRDLAIRAAAPSTSTATLTHQQNMPLGISSCACAECVSFRAKRNGGAA